MKIITANVNGIRSATEKGFFDWMKRQKADVVCLHAKDEVERFCRGNPGLHVYSLGDLDDFFWPHTTWYALRDGGRVTQLVLVYTGQPLPTVLAIADPPVGPMRDLLRGLLRVLPRRFYAHLTEGVADALTDDYRLRPHGLHHKMVLADPKRAAAVDASAARVMGVAPERVRYLAKAAGWLGPIGESEILQVGEPIAEVATPFALVEKIPAQKALLDRDSGAQY